MHNKKSYPILLLISFTISITACTKRIDSSASFIQDQVSSATLSSLEESSLSFESISNGNFSSSSGSVEDSQIESSVSSEESSLQESSNNEEDLAPNGKPYLSSTYEGIKELSVHFIYLGCSGDCILFDYGDYEVLIDAGGSSSKTGPDYIVPYLKQYVDGDIDLGINTHQDADHIFGYGIYNGKKYDTGVFKQFHFKEFIKCNYKNEESASQIAFDEFLAEQEANGTEVYPSNYFIENDDPTLYISPDFSITILDSDYYWKSTSNHNNASTATLIRYKNNTFFMAGDAEIDAETSIAKLNDLPNVDVYKASHHGSNTGSNTALLEEIQPKMAIMTANSATETTYNFPVVQKVKTSIFNGTEFETSFTAYDTEEKALDRLYPYVHDNMFVSYYNGNIVLTSDGDTISVNCSLRQNSFDYETYKRMYPLCFSIAKSKTTRPLAKEIYDKLSEEEKAYVYNANYLV